MVCFYAVVLLILNYLLVVVAGTAERPAKVIDRLFPTGTARTAS